MRQVGADDRPPLPIEFGTSNAWLRLDALHAGGPEHGGRLDVFVADLHAVAVDSGDRAVCPDLHAERLPGRGSRGGELARETR